VEDLSGAPTIIKELDRQKLGAAILWKFIQRVANPQKLPTLNELVPKVHSEYLFDDENQARQYLSYQSQNLLKYMQERRNQKTWGSTRLFRQLLECELPAQSREKMAHITVRTRDYQLNVVKVDYHTSSDEEPPDGHQPVSSLRPRGGKGSARKSKSYRGREVAQDLDDQMSSPVSTSAKRKFSETLHEPDLRRKLRVRSVDGESQGESSEEPAEEPAPTTALTLRWKRDADGSGASVVTDGAGQFEANAPGDVWRCTVVGCVHAVYGASGKLGQRLIEEHVVEHRGDDDAPQVNLAVREMQKCKLPVRYVVAFAIDGSNGASNLIKKIREFAAAQDLANTTAGAEQDDSPAYPTRIRRLVSQ
jgi:hypothetical protein